MSNETLADLLDVCPLRISHLLKKLKHKGYIIIKNGQSKYRRIYFNENANVQFSLPISFAKCADDQPISLDQDTLSKTSTINTKNFNKKKYNTSVITFSFETGTFDKITTEILERWARAYPAVDIESELLRAAEWLLANPKRQKTNYTRFLTNWFNRSEERKGAFHNGNTTSRQAVSACRPGEYVR